MSQKDNCIQIKCIYNDKLHKGLCTGVSKDTNSYPRDVIRMCWVKKPPSLDPNKPCQVTMQVQMTPNEADVQGASLIKASIVGETLLRNLDATRVKHEKKENKNESENIH